MPVDSPTVANAETASNRTSRVGRLGQRQQDAASAEATRPTESSATVSAWRWTPVADAAVEGVDVGLAAHLGVDDEEEQDEGGDLDAAGGAGGAAADEHQHVGAQQGAVAHLAVVEAVEAGGARHHRLEEARQQPPRRAQRAQGARVGPLAGGDEDGPSDQQDDGDADGHLGVQAPPPGRRRWRRSSNSTGKPRPPTMTATAIGRQIHGSVTNPIRLSVYSAKPALLNAETAWKTPR